MVSSPLTLQSIQPRRGADPQVVLFLDGLVVRGSWQSGPPSLSLEAPCHRDKVASSCGFACVCLALPLESGPEGKGSKKPSEQGPREATQDGDMAGR